MPEGHKFAADSMVGGLGKWLRLLGFDTIYLRRGPRDPSPDRILVTRRSSRPRQPGLTGWARIITLQADDTLGQLQELVRVLDLTIEQIKPLTRCSVCNRLLRPAEVPEVADRVPEYIRVTQKRFSVCPGCGRVYWPGTHPHRMVKTIEALFQNRPANGPTDVNLTNNPEI